MGPVSFISRQEELFDRLREAINGERWEEAKYLSGIGSFSLREVEWGDYSRPEPVQDRSAFLQWDKEFELIPFSSAHHCNHECNPGRRGSYTYRRSWCDACRADGVLASCGHKVHVNRASRENSGWNPRTQIAENIKCDKCRKFPARTGVKNRPGFVYRLFDDSGILLYVGKTYRVTERLYGKGGHSHTKEWWNLVAVVDVSCFSRESLALEAEAWAIKEESPKYNKALPVPRKKSCPAPIARYAGSLA